ncbi:phenylacetate--CoA ligase family protein [Confluentibacter flavum]|uniref:Phenylacetate--CoA ligase n=1 Tax=Confluentibacter flavum TaxID=1909700 RepID=A0A2N3HKN0_9FLAO|nr:AMP-binding protein [Confluentibacter flavum]PKQ45491.1 phenylacetate--CoA ligase [Confluentibacter flavum]
MIQDIEKQSIIKIKEFQEQKLKDVLLYVKQKSPFYKRLFDYYNIDIAEIKFIEDLIKIPPTTKNDLQLYNDDFLCVPKQDIIDYVITSGTLGEPITFALTDRDLDRLANNEAISLDCAGVSKQDIIQVMTTLDRRFMAGIAYFLGARRLGSGIIRTGAGIPELQWDSILNHKPTYLIVVPSFLLKLIEFANVNGIDINNSGIKGAICIGEPIRNDDFSLNTLGQKIKDAWDIQLYSTYASTEMNTAFTECEHQNGGHHHPELIIVEILNEDNSPVNNGEIGELTITTLGIEAMPLIRFKTGDMLRTHDEPCKCGRTSLRLGPVKGRRKQMIKYKGTTLFPPSIQNVMNHFKDVDSFIIEVFHNDVGTDEILIKIATHYESPELLQQIKDHFRAKLRVTPHFEFHEKNDIDKLRFPKLSRKPIVFIDKRTTNGI